MNHHLQTCHANNRFHVLAIILILAEASFFPVVVLLLDPSLVRYFVVYASRIGFTNGEYLYFALDLFLDGLLTSGGSWKRSRYQLR